MPPPSFLILLCWKGTRVVTPCQNGPSSTKSLLNAWLEMGKHLFWVEHLSAYYTSKGVPSGLLHITHHPLFTLLLWSIQIQYPSKFDPSHTLSTSVTLKLIGFVKTATLAQFVIWYSFGQHCQSSELLISVKLSELDSIISFLFKVNSIFGGS